MTFTSFRCESPDFLVRSPDGTSFAVKRSALLKSEVFSDMFACCDPAEQETLELHDTGSELIALLHLLHDPPKCPVELPVEKFQPIQYDATTIIPFPILLLFFRLADKYGLADSVIKDLRIHLLAQAPTYPLEVYSFATLHDMEWEASGASQYVLPMAAYNFEEIKVIPNVVAYHKLVRLQDYRVKALRDLLLGEDIFPHGYGECAAHRDKTMVAWDRQRKALMGRIESATDIASEMDSLTDTLHGCKTCHKACVAAVEMLAHKCKRVPRRLDQLPNI